MPPPPPLPAPRYIKIIKFNKRIDETQLSSPLKGSGADTASDCYGIIFVSVGSKLQEI